MRILIIVSRDSAHPRAAGGDRHLTQLGQGLARHGHQVTLVSASDPSLPRRESDGGLTIERLSPPRTLFAATWGHLLSDLHGRYDVVIEETMGGERAPFLARLLAGSPTVQFWYQDNRGLFATLYGPIGRAIGAGLQDLLLRLNRSGFSLANSTATREWLATQGIPYPRTAVSYPKVDPTFVPTELPGFGQRSDRFVTIGNFRRTKRFEEAIRVLAKLRTHHPHAELALVGREEDVAYLQELRDLAANLGLSEEVDFRFGVTEEEKFRILSEAKVLTIHSPVEGFGWTIPEAGLCGVPAVGNQGVPKEVLREGRNGERVAYGDVEAYARSVGHLLSDAAAWRTLSEGAQAVAREFVNGPVEPAVLELLQRAAGSGRVRGSPREARLPG